MLGSAPGTAPRTTQVIGSRSDNVVWQYPGVTCDARQSVTGLRGATVWFTGLPGAGKTTLARSVERRLLTFGAAAYVLDGDNMRHGLTGDLGFSREDRAENVRRIAHVALILADAGVISLVALISPYADDRAIARNLHTEAGHAFLEVWVDTPSHLCERRDPKGLYVSARRGALTGFTGIDAPYETPLAPELRVRPQSVRAATDAVLRTMRQTGILRLLPRSPGASAGRLSSAATLLTLREREILSLLEQGLTNKEIARRLSIQASTVKNHVHHILVKLGAVRRGEAVAVARHEVAVRADGQLNRT